MSWKNRLLPASFRGIEFFVEDSEYGTGRRTTQHEFPDRYIPFADDLGRISDSYNLEGYILGDDYFERRNQLIQAFQQEGPGEFIHPYYGLKRVQCGQVSFKESQKQGRIVIFSVTLREAGLNQFPKGANDKGAQLFESTQNALTELEEDFGVRFITEDQPGFSLDSVRGWIADAQESFDSSTEDVATVADGVAELAFSTRNLVAETEDLLQSPGVLAGRLLNSLSLIRGAVETAKESYLSYKNLFEYGAEDDELIETTPTRIRVKQNKATFDSTVRTAAAIRAAEDASTSEWQSLEEAQEARDAILEVLEQQIETTENDELYQALKDVEANLVSVLPDDDSDLPQEREVEIPETTNTLNISYDIFESLDQEQDIIDRNSISNPAFVAGGRTIEVLSVNRQSNN